MFEKEGREKGSVMGESGAQSLLGLAAPAWSSREGDLKPVTYILGKGLEKTLW